MRVLWLAPEPPVPPLTGGRERARRMLVYLAQRHTVSLVTFATAKECSGLADLRPTLAGLTAVPYPAGRQRRSAQMQAAVHALWQRFRPDVIHVQGLDMWPYAPRNKRRVLDLHDVPDLLLTRLQSLRRNLPLLAAWRQRWDLVRLRRHQRRAVAAAAAVIVPSAVDDDALRQRYPQATITTVILPNGVDLASWSSAAPEPDTATVLFPGALNWEPNVDAAAVLIRDILPLVQARVPTARVVIAGRRPDPAVWAWARAYSAVTLMPDPVDMQAVFARATVVAVPLRAATGTRVKILQALASGRAVVSTPAGAAGLELVDGRHLCVASLIAPFANAVADLLTDPARRLRLSQAGRLAVEQYDWQRHLPALDAVYQVGKG